MTAFILPLSDSAAIDPEKVGPKAANLATLTQAGLPTPKEKPAARAANVVNLMDALRRSIEDKGSKAKPAKAPSKRATEAAPKKRAKKAG